MVSKEQLTVFGGEIRRRRLDQGIKTLTEMHKKTKISRAFLSQIENAYEHPKRGLVVPTDTMIERLAQTLDMPIARLHELLGRFPEVERTYSPDAEAIAEEFDRLPSFARRIVQEAVKTAKQVAAQVDEERPLARTRQP